MKLNQINWKLILTGTLAAQAACSAMASDDSDIQALKQEIQDLDQKVRILERQREIDQDAETDAKKAAPQISIGSNGASFSSSDSNFVAQLHGLIQLDSRTFFNDGGVNGNDGFLLRRARIIMSGTVYRNFDYLFTTEFGGSTLQILDANINYHYNSAFQLQVGKLKPPVGLEAYQAEANNLFNERALATDLVPYRDLGLLLHGDVLDGRASYALGLVNGSPDYSTTTTNSSFQDFKTVDSRLFFQPWKTSTVDALQGLGFGVAGDFQANHPNTNSATGLTSGYTSDGQQKLFTYSSGVAANGPGWRISPQAYYYYGPLGVMGEYVISDQKVALNGVHTDLQNKAWEVSGSWILTGEDASYNGVTPAHPFDLHGGQWGAWQVVARYGDLSVDDHVFTDHLASPLKSADEAQAWAVGLNWYLNRNIRANLSFSHTVFSGYTGGTLASDSPGLAHPENVLFSRIGISF